MIYTCPMHPGIRRIGPGECPKCGMALEPRTVALEEEVNPEFVDMTRRFWVATVLAVPVFVSAVLIIAAITLIVWGLWAPTVVINALWLRRVSL